MESSPVASSTTFAVLTSLAAPTLSWPVNNSSSPITVTLTPTVSWSAVFGASGYYIDLVDQTTNQVILTSAPVNGTSYTPSTPLAVGDTYQWRVMAYSSGGLLSPLERFCVTPFPEAFIPTLSIGNVTLAEGNSGTTTFNFTVSISATNTLPTSVSFATADGTATAASGDYVATSGTLTWIPATTRPRRSALRSTATRPSNPTRRSTSTLTVPARPLSTSTGLGTIVNDDLSVYSVVVAEATLQQRDSRIEREPEDHLGDIQRRQPGRATVTVDGKTITPISGPYGGLYYSCPIGTWAAGDHSYAIQSTDSKGVSGTATGTFAVVAPPDSDPLIGQVVVSQAKGRISWNVVDPDGVASSTITVDTKSVSNVSGPFNASSGVNFSAANGSLAAGGHSYTITATDKLGNQFSSNGVFYHRQPAARTISQMAVSETKDRISWNAFDADGVAGSTVAIDRENGIEHQRPLRRVVRRELLRHAGHAPRRSRIATRLPQPTGPATWMDSERQLRLVQRDQDRPDDQPGGGVADERADQLERLRHPGGERTPHIQIDGTAVADILGGPLQGVLGRELLRPVGSILAGTHSYKITATDAAGNVSVFERHVCLGLGRHQNALASAAALSAFSNRSNSAKVDWLYDFGGLLGNAPADSGSAVSQKDRYL